MIDLKQLAAEPDCAGGSPTQDRVWQHAVGPGAKDDASVVGSDSFRPADLRVLYVDNDDTGTRNKDWRNVILESKTVTYADVPLDGPLSALNWCRHTHRFGGNPRRADAWSPRPYETQNGRCSQEAGQEGRGRRRMIVKGA